MIRCNIYVNIKVPLQSAEVFAADKNKRSTTRLLEKNSDLSI